MRGRILWAAVLASMLCGLALGLSALAATAPDSTWNVVASMPQPLYGAAGASNGTYAYAAGGIDAVGATLDTFYRYNPVNERWDTYPPPMPAAEAKASAVYYPATNSIYVFGGENLEHGRGQRRHEGLRHHGEHVELRREHAGPPPLDVGRLRQRERKDVPGRRLRHRRPVERPDDGVGIQPRRRTRSRPARRSLMPSAAPPPVSSATTSTWPVGTTPPGRSSASSGTTASRRIPGRREPACRPRPTPQAALSPTAGSGSSEARPLGHRPGRRRPTTPAVVVGTRLRA